MIDQSAVDPVSDRHNNLIDELIRYGQYESGDGRQLYELSLADLERLHIKVKCDLGRKMSSEAGD